MDRLLAGHTEPNRSGEYWPWWRCAITGLSALALVSSAYLGWHHLAGGSLLGCGGGSPCDEVLTSRWSSIAGVLPVSGLAAGAYLAVLVASLFIGPTTETPVRRLAWRAMLVLVGAAVGSAVWFTIVQRWIIGAFCLYCMATHLTGVLLAVLVLWRAPAAEAVSWTTRLPSPQPSPIGWERAPATPRRAFALVGLALAGVLAGSQVALTPKPVAHGGESQGALAAIDPHAVPLVGSPSALHVVKVLFDYQCPHCQQLYFMLSEVVRRYGGKLAFALFPAPLSSQCNPYIAREVDEFKDSCELAKVGLAVWRANREAFSAFELWMFSLESGDRWRPRRLDDARAKAIELVGQARFEAARADPWIDRHLQTAVKLFGDTGGNAIPKLVFGSRWVIPQAYDADGLVSILQDRLGVPAPGGIATVEATMLRASVQRD